MESNSNLLEEKKTAKNCKKRRDESTSDRRDQKQLRLILFVLWVIQLPANASKLHAHKNVQKKTQLDKSDTNELDVHKMVKPTQDR